MNTYERAREEFKAYICGKTKELSDETITTISCALDKYIPKKPLIKDGSYWCPCCGDAVEISQDNCPWCAQRFDWE